MCLAYNRALATMKRSFETEKSQLENQVKTLKAACRQKDDQLNRERRERGAKLVGRIRSKTSSSIAAGTAAAAVVMETISQSTAVQADRREDQHESSPSVASQTDDGVEMRGWRRQSGVAMRRLNDRTATSTTPDYCRWNRSLKLIGWVQCFVMVTVLVAAAVVLFVRPTVIFQSPTVHRSTAGFY